MKLWREKKENKLQYLRLAKEWHLGSQKLFLLQQNCQFQRLLRLRHRKVPFWARIKVYSFERKLRKGFAFIQVDERLRQLWGWIQVPRQKVIQIKLEQSLEEWLCLLVWDIARELVYIKKDIKNSKVI